MFEIIKETNKSKILFKRCLKSFHVHMHGNILLSFPLNHDDLHAVIQYSLFEPGHVRFYEFLDFLPQKTGLGVALEGTRARASERL